MIREQLLKELQFKAIRSSGSGGQHVNKVSSKIELQFNLETSNSFSNEEKILLFKNLKPRLTKFNILILHCHETRSQHKNKDIVIERFLQIIANALIVPKKRKATKPNKSSIQRRLDKKKKIAYKKAFRRKPEL